MMRDGGLDSEGSPADGLGGHASTPSRAQHSQGPWRASLTRGQLNGGVTVKGVASADGVNVAWVTIASPDFLRNLALVKAAPDLLDFAQSMVVALDLAAELFPADAIHFAQFAEDARAVIAKAEGSSEALPSGKAASTTPIIKEG